MRANKAEQYQALIPIMNRMVEEIRGLELELGIQASEGDYRPRIEYFHDAVRIFSENGPDAHNQTGRLSVEHLAYDVATLRQIQANPLNWKYATKKTTPTTTIVKHGDHSHILRGGNSMARSQLAEQYKNYVVLFAAMFAEPVDRNFQTRVDQLDTQVEDMAAMQQMIQMMVQNQGAQANVDMEAMIQNLDDPELKHKLMVFLHEKAQAKRMKAELANQFMKAAMNGVDREIAAIDKAHMNYLTSQLMVYENSKEVVKKLASQGLNIAGQFVESAVSQAQRGQTRGR